MISAKLPDAHMDFGLRSEAWKQADAWGNRWEDDLCKAKGRPVDYLISGSDKMSQGDMACRWRPSRTDSFWSLGSRDDRLIRWMHWTLLPRKSKASIFVAAWDNAAKRLALVAALGPYYLRDRVTLVKAGVSHEVGRRMLSTQVSHPQHDSLSSYST